MLRFVHHLQPLTLTTINLFFNLFILINIIFFFSIKKYCYQFPLEFFFLLIEILRTQWIRLTRKRENPGIKIISHIDKLHLAKNHLKRNYILNLKVLERELKYHFYSRLSICLFFYTNMLNFKLHRLNTSYIY